MATKRENQHDGALGSACRHEHSNVHASHKHKHDHHCSEHEHQQSLGNDTVHHEHQHTHDESTKKRTPLIDVLSNHPVLKILQAFTGLLMIPMIPLMGFEFYKSTSSAFESSPQMPTTPAASLRA